MHENWFPNDHYYLSTSLMLNIHTNSGKLLFVQQTSIILINETYNIAGTKNWSSSSSSFIKEYINTEIMLEAAILVLKPVHLIPVDAGHKPAARFCLE
jgi:hypothetical protein